LIETSINVLAACPSLETLETTAGGAERLTKIDSLYRLLFRPLFTPPPITLSASFYLSRPNPLFLHTKATKPPAKSAGFNCNCTNCKLTFCVLMNRPTMVNEFFSRFPCLCLFLSPPYSITSLPCTHTSMNSLGFGHASRTIK
jgi:hypothetical protein